MATHIAYLREPFDDTSEAPYICLRAAKSAEKRRHLLNYLIRPQAHNNLVFLSLMEVKNMSRTLDTSGKLSIRGFNCVKAMEGLIRLAHVFLCHVFFREYMLFHIFDLHMFLNGMVDIIL